MPKQVTKSRKVSSQKPKISNSRSLTNNTYFTLDNGAKPFKVQQISPSHIIISESTQSIDDNRWSSKKYEKIA